MDIVVERQDNRFRIKTQGFCFGWWKDTPVNRQVVVVALRGMQDSTGKRMFTLQELAGIVGSEHRQAASQHVEDFRQRGEDFKTFVMRKRKVDETVVEGVREEVLRRPLASNAELSKRVGERLGRTDISVANIEAALGQISCEEVRRVVREQMEKGEVHYKEEYLLGEILKLNATGGEIPAGIEVPYREEPQVLDPTGIRTLLKPGAELEDIPGGLQWVVFCLAMYGAGVSLSRLGSWLGVHKTTVLRWMIGLVCAVWTEVSQWIVKGVRAGVVYVDEKWIKIRGKWHYWYVVLDKATEIPICTYLADRRTLWAVKWLETKVRLLGYQVRSVVHDGLSSYMSFFPEKDHQRCLFHHQQGVTQWLRENLGEDQTAKSYKNQMKQVIQTRDKRTVKRRLSRLAQQGGVILGWVKQTIEQLPFLLPAIGNSRLPSTTNAIERFFRTFNRFYKVRCGFHSVQSAHWELLLFLVVYLFTQRAKDGKAPIEAIVPDAVQMPLYRLLNDPFLVLGRSKNVKQIPEMANEMALARLAA